MRFAVLIAAVVALGAVVAGCGGYGDSDTPTPARQASASARAGVSAPFDVDNGNAVAREIIPPLTEVLGEGWGLDEEDQFDGSPFAMLGEGPACDAIRDRAARIGERLDSTSVGRAQRGYSLDGAGDVTLAPGSSVIVRIYATPEEATAMAAAYRDLFEDENYATCTRETAANDERNPVTVVVSGPAATPPPGGSGTSLRVQAPGDSEGKEILLLELYSWAHENAFVEVVVGGTEHVLDPSLAPKVVVATQERLQRIAGGEVLPIVNEDD